MNRSSIGILSLLVMGAAVNAAPAPVVDVNSDGLDKRITVLERMVNTRTDTQQRMQQQLDEVQNEVNELRGSVELHSHKLEQILERQRELYLEIDKRIEAVVKKPSLTPLSTNQAMIAAQAAPVAVGENEAYDRAVNLILKDKQYDQAIPEFEAFLKLYPNSSYVANAYYWLGQLLFNKQEWDRAAEYFNSLVTQFTDSTKRADSMLKLGMIAQKKNNIANARQTFEKVMQEYPDSSAAKLASSRLKSLK
ncbi:tol-pal system protein YbgF [Alteromonadaceae bacterium BrNp21-10]|nr:tol-pal system protein YbgF [Alteromonadaceae bacterium BrNp21-10]